MITEFGRIESELAEMERVLRVRNYADKTRESYLSYCSKFFNFVGYIPEPFDQKLVEKFIVIKQKEGCAPQTINLYINAIKFFYKNIAQDKSPFKLKFAKRSLKLPVVLSSAEIQKLISVIKNLKHQLIISMAYGSGLRVAETANLKVCDVDLDRNLIHLRETKGGSHRVTILSNKIKPTLDFYLREKMQYDYVFESNRGGKLSTRTLQKIFKNALKAAGIRKPATFHSLRHSFATHLYESGVNISHIQKLLGHKKIETTQIYTKTAKPAISDIRSPL